MEGTVAGRASPGRRSSLRDFTERNPDMDPTEVLEQEHEVVLHVLDAAEEEIAFIDDEGVFRPARLEMMVDFFANFTYRCHHAKEEQHLFPLLARHGMSQQEGLIAELLAEHEEGHEVVDAVDAATAGAEAGEEAQLLEVRDGLRHYCELIREHIRKENEELYPRARKVLAGAENQRLVDAFDAVEREEMGEGVHERYHSIAHQLAEG
jgi:hemerythrin-like domain-containing protein